MCWFLAFFFLFCFALFYNRASEFILLYSYDEEDEDEVGIYCLQQYKVSDNKILDNSSLKTPNN